MNKRIAKKLDSIHDKINALYDELQDILDNEIEPQADRANEYAEEHENSEKAQEKAELWTNSQTELSIVIDSLESVRDELMSVYCDFLD